jgi:hypothetical protein
MANVKDDETETLNPADETEADEVDEVDETDDEDEDTEVVG